MIDEELAFAPATELLQLLRDRAISPVELNNLYFARIERLNPQLRAFLALTRERAETAAAEAERAIVRGDETGPLHGLPIAIKDTQSTAGVPTTMGSLLMQDNVPSADAAIVERVLAAGALMQGKTNVPEFGMPGTCENRLGEPGTNPWNPDCTPGGSSGGAAAAVAAGLCPLATGSDGGGSIRIPANFCGIYGIKPTHGRVSHFTGTVSDPMPNLFSQNGPLTRTVADAALLLQVLSGHDPRDPLSLRLPPPDYAAALHRDVAGLRLAWSPDFGFADVHPDVARVTAAAARVFEELGCHLEESDLTMEPPYNTYGPIQAADAHTRLGAQFAAEGERMTEFARYMIEYGAGVTTAQYARGLGEIDRFKSRMTTLFETYDLLLSPTACFTAFVNGPFPGDIEGSSIFPEQYWNGAFTLPINAIGHPAATVPAGFSSHGLPIGLHIVGAWGDEATVLAASAAFERARPWRDHRPPIS